MLYNTFEQDKEYLWKKFQSPVFDESTGFDNETLKQKALEFKDLQAPVPVIKARAFEFVARNMRIDVNPHDWFPAFGCWDRNDRPLSPLLQQLCRKTVDEKVQHIELWNNLNKTGASNIWIDFDHSVPDWEDMLPLGFSGLRERACQYRKRMEDQQALTPEKATYFDGIEITYTALLKTLDRFHAYALAHPGERVEKVAESLKNLRNGAPQNTYEVLQFIYLYFMFCEHIDRLQVRSLGNLDNLLLPYFERDLKNGTFTEENIREFVDYFLMQWGSINNYWGHPFYLGGTDEHGNSRINKMSYLILEEFDKLSIPTPKIQLKIAENTPDDFLNLALKMIRHGNSSLVFLGEKGIRRAMTGCGMTEEDARKCDIRGCYEFNARGYHNENTTGCGHLNMLKPFEFIFNNGTDPKTGLQIGRRTGDLSELKTFDDFYRAYILQLESIIEANIACVNDFERFLSEINPTNVFSASIRYSLETAKDAFHNGSFYNDTSILNVGFGSAVDALTVIRKFVYEQNEITLEEFKQILADNWNGHEKQRRKILADKQKYGNGIESVDRYADMLGRYLGTKINGRPNGRGGIWKNSGHSARQFIELGKRTGATPDGRLDGEEMSKNLSPAMGADISGITALIRSITTMDSACFTGDFPLDAMLHPSSVAGEEGLAAWRTLIRTYMDRNGIAIHFNIFDAETLKDAQKNPEKYTGLQVRVCGWNVHFTELAASEQDMYIRRAENLAE